MRALVWLLGLLGLAALLLLTLHAGAAAILSAIVTGGMALLWMLPLHAAALLLDAQGWRALLRALSQSVPLSRLFAIATVREAINRLLPVANIGGEVVGIRLLRWCDVDASQAAASVVVEVVMTLVSQYLFALLGMACLLHLGVGAAWMRPLLWTLTAALPLLLALGVLLRRGDLFTRLFRAIESSLGLGAQWSGLALSAQLDQATGVLCRAPATLAVTVAWQLGGLICGALENYWVLRLLQHPVPLGGALALESLAQLIRQLIFVVPAGLGVQEAGLTALGALLGVAAPAALALSLIKRGREILFSVPPLLTWQWLETRRTGLFSDRAPTR